MHQAPNYQIKRTSVTSFFFQTHTLNRDSHLDLKLIVRVGTGYKVARGGAARTARKNGEQGQAARRYRLYNIS